MRVGKTTSITLPAERKSLTKVRDFADKYGEKFGYNMHQVNGFRLSLDEICTNIIMYAYEDRPTPGDIRIEITRQLDSVVTRIIDNGRHFDYSTVVDPDLNRYINEQRMGGLGIYLVRNSGRCALYSSRVKITLPYAIHALKNSPKTGKENRRTSPKGALWKSSLTLVILNHKIANAYMYEF